VLTIDRNIQSFTEEALRRGIEKAEATEGSVVVMNPNTGEVLAMANYPTYDPAQYNKVEDSSIFMNPITMVAYEPGSVIKTFLMASAVDKGVVTPESTYQNTDCIQVIDQTMCNVERGLNRTMTMQEVLTYSLNTGTITAGRRFGNGSQINLQARQGLYEYYHDRLGFGGETGIELSEVPGYIYPPDSVEGNEVRYSAMTYGQSMDLTTIQVAAALCSVVNGGQYYRPTVVAGVIDGAGAFQRSEHKPVRQAISEKTSGQMREMLQVVRSANHIVDREGYTIGSKSGTSQAVVDGRYSESEAIATYIGYGGVERPEYVIIVRVAAPGKGLSLWGGTHAGPIFAEISDKMIDYMKLIPRN
jgi:cell division protein FtsI/penicillin-binding protein 2